MKVIKRGILVRSRLMIIRVLVFLTGAGIVSLFVYWRGLTSSQLIALAKPMNQVNGQWERSAAFRAAGAFEDDPEDFDDDLVADSKTSPPEEPVTLEFNIDLQLEQDILEFGQELESLGIPAPEQEDRHIGVERREVQPWELEVEDLYDEDKDYDDGLTIDDHIPGLVDDTKQARDEDDLALDREHSLLEDDLEAVARLAEEEAMRDAEEMEWAKLGEVEEAREWKSEADVDWEKEDAELIAESRKQRAEDEQGSSGKRRKTKTSKKGKTKILEDDEEDEDEDEEEEEEEEEERFEGEMTTLEATTPESPEEVAIEEAEEAEIFGPLEQRKIERILLKLGIGRNRRLRYVLEKTANWKRNIIITLSDSRYTMLTLNFYENTVLKLGLKNVLFASLDGRLCTKLDALNIPCFIYARAPITGADFERGVRKIFNSKIYLRARLILEALAMGYNVAYVDTDTMLLKDPFPALREECQGKCDVAFQQMTNASRRLSWGLVYARPSLRSLYLFYALVKKTANRTISLPDKFINRLDREGKLHLARLPLWRFRSGIDYFSYVKFGWDDKCIGCISIHCDETFSKDAKIYRMKELLRWNLDMEGYYSKRRRKYITYDNPYVFHNGTETLIMEMRALRNALALGHILRRVVILPKFHCFVPPPLEGEPDPGSPPTKWCNLHDILRIEEFHRWYMGHYREHSFLAHRKVPRPLKRNMSAIFYIGQKMPEDSSQDGAIVEAVNVTLVKPRSPLYGAHAEEIRSFFEHEDASILRFHSLYYGFSHFLSDDVARGFNRKIKFGFVFRTRVRYNVKKLKVKAPERKVASRPEGVGVMPGTSILAPPGHLMAQAQAMMGRAKSITGKTIDDYGQAKPPSPPINHQTPLQHGASQTNEKSSVLDQKQEVASEMFISQPRAPHQPEKTDMFLPPSASSETDKEKLLPRPDIPLEEEQIEAEEQTKRDTYALDVR